MFFLNIIVFENFAFMIYYCAVASMFDSSIFTHKYPAFSFQKLNRSGASVWDDIRTIIPHFDIVEI